MLTVQNGTTLIMKVTAISLHTECGEGTYWPRLEPIRSADWMIWILNTAEQRKCGQIDSYQQL